MSSTGKDILDFPIDGTDEQPSGFPGGGFGGFLTRSLRKISVTLPTYPGVEGSGPTITVVQEINNTDMDTVVTVSGKVSTPEEYSALCDIIAKLA